MAKQQKPAWVYLFAGLTVGLFVAFLLFLSHQKSADPVDINEAIEQALPHNKPNKPAKDEEKKTELGFYDLLPELEVTVTPDLQINIGTKPDSAPNTPAPAITPSQNPNTHSNKPATNTAKAGAVYWQVGSFSQFSGADKQKATLLLNNWPAKIQQAQLSDGRKVYRVFVGPYNAEQAAQNAGSALKKQGLNPVKHTVKS